MRSSSLLSALVLTCVCLNATGGAKEHFINGQEYYEQGRYKDAIDEFDKAYNLDAKPLLLYNTAQAYEKLGNLKKSVEYLKRFLKSGSAKMDTKSVQNKIANLEKRIKQTGITVAVNESGADIYVDDRKIATSPTKGVLVLDEGMHKVRIVKQGFKDFTMNVGVSTGHSVPVDAKLEPAGESYVSTSPVIARKDDTEPTSDPAPAPAEPSDATVPPASEETPPEEVPAPAETPENKGVEPLDIVPWVIAGVGAVTAVVGLGVIGGMAMSNDDEDQALLADVVGWPGVAIAVGGATWGIVRLIKKKKNNESQNVSVLPLVTPHIAGMAASMTF